MAIKAVLFDMGNTLVKYDYGAPEEVFQKVLFSLGIRRSLNNIRKAFLNAEDEAEDLNLIQSLGRMKCEEYWNQWDALVLKHLGIVENGELAKTVHSKWFDFVDCTLFPEVKDVLSSLKQRGLKLGLISTAYEEEIYFILEEADLEKTIFDIIVGVDAIRKVKPDPDIFNYAISRLDVKPEEAIFVGDNLEADYEGAQNAGMQALLLDRTGKNQSHLNIIKSLEDIFSRII